MTAAATSVRTTELLRFLDTGITAVHATNDVAARLEAAGFTRFDEADQWELAPGTCGYVVRGGTSVIAFRVGSTPAAEAGFRIVGAHTDVPGLRLKPNSPQVSSGYRSLGVEIYGGPILSSWADRDLTLAGRVYLKNGNDIPVMKLVDFHKPVCRIPQVAIHLNREVNSKGLMLDKQKHMPPVVGLDNGEAFTRETLTARVAALLDEKPENIVDYNLEVVDTQHAAIGGLDDELYFSGRIDNLGGSFTCLAALLEASHTPAHTQVMALFDNEEIGSSTYNGAQSNFLDVVLERLAGSREAFLRSLANTLLASNDGAHAVHPNYAELHEPNHKPVLNGGPVLKINANERYVTGSRGAAYLVDLCQRAEVPLQKIVVRTDMPCGSTIGPIVSTRLGIEGFDLGLPMLSMHSIRETGGVKDADFMVKALAAHLG